MSRGSLTRRVFRVELGKAFRNPFFLLSVLIGTVLVAVNATNLIRIYYQEGGTYARNVSIATFADQLDGYLKYPVLPAATVYNQWIGGDYSGEAAGSIFFTILPLLVILPYGHSVSEEMRSGYLKTIIPRCGRRRYFLAKAGAMFLSGGTAVLLPMILSLLICFMAFPAVKVDMIYDMYGALHHSNMASVLFNQHPLLYTLMYLGIDFVFSGLFACMAFSASFFWKQRVAPMIVPYLFLLGMESFRSVTMFFTSSEISILIMLKAGVTPLSTKADILLLWLALCLLLTAPIIYWKGRKYEIF